MKRCLLFLFVLGMVANAQRDTMRARITGDRGDRGKCTLEVVVDTAADVEFTGDTGRLITVAGNPANWVRIDCSEPMPRDPQEFRFRGIDGRGDVRLIRDPRSNRGIAVVHIEDRKGGREGYTFDLEWRGGSNYGGGGFPGRGRGGYDGGRGGYDGGRGGGRDGYIVACQSDRGRRSFCRADTSRGVRLVRELNGSRCRQGDSWGFNQEGIWVDRGCRGEFEVGR
jgi:hypothetical protein